MTTDGIKKVLIDGDVILYKAGFVCEKSSYFVGKREFSYKREAQEYAETNGGEVVKKRESFSANICYKILTEIVTTILETIGCDNYVIAVGSSGKTFRHDIAVTAPYKGNRKSSDKPLLFDKAKKYLLENFNCVIADDGLEADDVLGILQNDIECTIIASIDKDLLMLPGRHYNINTKEVILSTDPGSLTLKKTKSNKLDLKGTGFKWFCAQMLLGDAVDNIIKPKKGLGPRKVHNLLNKLDTKEALWKEVSKHYTDPKRLHENAKLLWIWRKFSDSYLDYL